MPPAVTGFVTLPNTPAGTLIGRRWSSGSRSASTEEWSGSRGGSSSGSCPGRHTRAVCRSLLTAADPLRAHCRARGSSPVVGPEWKLEIRGATRCRMSAGSPYTR